MIRIFGFVGILLVTTFFAKSIHDFETLSDENEELRKLSKGQSERIQDLILSEIEREKSQTTGPSNVSEG